MTNYKDDYGVENNTDPKTVLYIPHNKNMIY